MKSYMGNCGYLSEIIVSALDTLSRGGVTLEGNVAVIRLLRGFHVAGSFLGKI